MLAGDLLAGEDIRVVLIDPALSSAFEIEIDQPVVAAPPVWLDDQRLVVVTGDAGSPLATIVDVETGDQTEGPSGDRLLATSADGKRVATMADQGSPIVIRDMAGWLAGDGSSIASIEPPGGSTTAITFALDTPGQRLAVAWAAERRLSHPRNPRRPLKLAPRRTTRHRRSPRRSRRLAPLEQAQGPKIAQPDVPAKADVRN